MIPNLAKGNGHLPQEAIALLAKGNAVEILLASKNLGDLGTLVNGTVHDHVPAPAAPNSSDIVVLAVEEGRSILSSRDISAIFGSDGIPPWYKDNMGTMLDAMQAMLYGIPHINHVFGKGFDGETGVYMKYFIDASNPGKQQITLKYNPQTRLLEIRAEDHCPIPADVKQRVDEVFPLDGFKPENHGYRLVYRDITLHDLVLPVARRYTQLRNVQRGA